MRKKKADRKRGELTIETVVIIIVLVLVLIAFYKMLFSEERFIPKWLADFIPSFVVMQAGKNNSYACPNIVAEIRLGYLYFNGIGSYLYYEEMKNQAFKKGSIKLAEGTMKKNPEIGIVVWNKEKNRDEVVMDREYIDKESQQASEYKNLLPDLSTMRKLDRAYKFKDQKYFCKTDQEIEELEKEKVCKNLKCALVNGECSKISQEGKVSSGKLDCREGEECYVETNLTMIGDRKMRLLTFISGRFSSGESTELINKGSIEVSRGEQRNINYGLVSERAYCYIVRSDKKILDSGFVLANERIKVPGVLFTPDDERFIEIIGFNSENNEKVIKRVRLEIKDSITLSDGKIIADRSFKEVLEAGQKSQIFYVLGIYHDWYRDGVVRMESLYYRNYRIEKISGESAFIYAEDKNPVNDQNIAWHKLDCDGKGVFMDWVNNPQSIKIKDIEKSLSMTLNKCKW